MRYLTVLISAFCLFFFSHAMGQRVDKQRLPDDPGLMEFGEQSNYCGKYLDRKLHNANAGWQIPYGLSLTEPVHFPYQNMYSEYTEAFPITLANGQILMVWAGLDTLKCAHSSDGGLNWGAPVVISSGGGLPVDLSGIRTSSDRVIAIWQIYQGLQMSYSDDNGINWSAPVSITNDGGDRYTTITQTLDDKLWLFYNRSNSSTQYDIYYRTSTDDGLNWSAEQTFLATSESEYFGTVVSGSGSTLLAFYNDAIFDIYLKTSTDGGATWSAATPIVNTSESEVRPRVLRQSNGDLWLIYYMTMPTPVLPGEIQRNIFYNQSFDGGNTWTSPTQFTQYVGYDAWHNANLVNDQPFISFISQRWEFFIGQRQIWYGLVGTTQDVNPPPAVFDGLPLAPAAETTIDIQAFVDDEAGVSDAQMYYSVNGTPSGPVQMFDDGLHNDENAGDNIWGGAIGPFQYEDFITYAFSVTDVTANTVNVESGAFHITPIHDIGNVILNFRSNSQLADQGNTSGSNAYWPRVNGDDYLFMGGLWIGANTLGDYRVMNIHYGEIDWTRKQGTPFTLAPGTSDQDGHTTFDDQFPQQQQPIGLQVHQRSYQWSDPNRYDFIIFKYIVQNTGANGNLSNLYTSVWLDPDVGDASSNLAGFDQPRSLIYTYNNQGTPGGYLGLKMLGTGNSLHTARAYNSLEDGEPSNDYERFQYMTSGFPPISTTVSDYRIILTAQPFDLAVGDSHSVAFGLVMGDGLTELQAHADTMEAIYNSVLVGIEDWTSNELPTDYSLKQNFPNPFNPVSRIEYALPRSERVTIKVYDLLGKEVSTLVDKHQPAGYHSVTFNGSHLASGIYFYQIIAGSFTQTRKMLLAK